MEELEKMVGGFPPISLDEMKSVGLMNRTDTKFVTTKARLAELLSLARGEYLVQETDAGRINNYSTVYFDTPVYDMFRTHQYGKANRQKLRIRSYREWGASFLEVKTKDNHRRTDKKRMRVRGFDSSQSRGDSLFSVKRDEELMCEDFLRENLRYETGSLSERIENRFRRVTLVNRGRTERLTIDTDVSFRNLETGRSLTLGNVVIIELKRDGRADSPVLGILRRLRIKPMGFSKYCIGMALTNPGLPRNRIKRRIRDIEKLENSN